MWYAISRRIKIQILLPLLFPSPSSLTNIESAAMTIEIFVVVLRKQCCLRPSLGTVDRQKNTLQQKIEIKLFKRVQYAEKAADGFLGTNTWSRSRTCSPRNLRLELPIRPPSLDAHATERVLRPWNVLAVFDSEAKGFALSLRIDSALEVKCCASNHIYVSSQGRHILASANAAVKVSRSYGYLSSKVE